MQTENMDKITYDKQQEFLKSCTEYEKLLRGMYLICHGCNLNCEARVEREHERLTTGMRLLSLLS